MKYLVSLVTILLFSLMAQSQHNSESFAALWKKVEQLENKALTTSALKLVNTIAEKAKKEKNDVQIVKTLLYSSKYAMTLEEEAQLKIITNFKTEIAIANTPTKNILQSYLASLYWQYFQQNRYQFYHRTKTNVKPNNDDFRTWDLRTLFNEIKLHFEASLNNENKLQQIKVSEFEAILHTKADTEEYRPTLYDLLAHNALSFYKTSENTITKAANTFEIDDANMLCNGTAFTELNFTSKDESALQLKALKTYQKLLQLHRTSNKPYTYAEVDIERLQFIYENAIFEQKEQQYLEVLQNAVAANKGKMAAGLYQFQIAALHHQRGTTYRANQNEKHRWKTAEALKICETISADFPNSRAASLGKALKSQILQKSLQLTAEKNITIQSTARILVNYTNVNDLKFSIRPVSQRDLKALEKRYPKEKKLEFIKKLTIAKEWNVTLKNEKDYQTHSTEIALPPLENGYYLVLAETNDKGDNTFSYSTIQATNLALSETQTDTHHYFQILNRQNGKPIAGANVTMRYQKNYERESYSKNFTTDAKGYITLPLNNENWNNVNIWVTYDNDTAYFEDYYVNRSYRQGDIEANYTCFLFTDRSMYRPGQPLYFKGIAMQQKERNSVILEKQNITVQLRDVNSQVVATSEFVTNDYGSFSGAFILPNTGLTGVFSLQATAKEIPLNGYASISVEEYKRPKFETSFESVSETYTVNDSIAVMGKAVAYAGSNITNAKVTYSVTRIVDYPRWCYWYYPNLRSASQEISHGETTTDASGNYKINFKALPDLTVDKENLPIFKFEVTADVTDINGETHSTQTVVAVGYHTMTAKMSIANSIDKDQKKTKLSIATNNLNGQFVPAKGVIKMYKLKAPASVNRPRSWPAPDYAGWTKEAFKKMFPHDAYQNEHDPSTWEKGALVWQANFDTEKANEILIDKPKKWLSGKYVLTLETNDKFGHPVKDILETKVFSHNDKNLADNALFEIKTDKPSYAVGEKAKISVLSNAADIYVTVNIEKNHTVIDTKLIHLNKNSKSFTVPITADDIGGFALTYSFAVYNHFQASSMLIAVPYPSSELEIETLTFRDKLKPGADETWSFKIKGPKGDAVAAELLANMYDASLDAFTNRTANAYSCFAIQSFNTHVDNQTHAYKHLNFDSFNWFGLHFGYGNYYGRALRRNKMMKSESAPGAMPSVRMADAIEFEESVVAASISSEVKVGYAVQNDEDDKQTSKPKEEKELGNKSNASEIKIRKNLQENAFFFPQLRTDEVGEVSFNFTTPEALTKWNVQLLAHTKKLESSYTSLATVTQKELMVLPNAPRFLREGDTIIISSKIANLTAKNLAGIAKLELVDALNGENISEKISIDSLVKDPQSKDTKNSIEAPFEVDSLGNTQVSWKLRIPEGIQAVQYTIAAKAGDFSDGEQNALPVLTNRMLVTETLPMWVRSNQSKTFTLEKLKKTSSSTLKHHRLTLEMTSNPAWYAVQALPYLMEYPYECNEQTFSKYYANALATHIANTNPSIDEVFKQWANSDALQSNLEKNQELKSLLIQETPWLRDAQSETEQKKRIGLLFDLNKMNNEQATALNKLKQNQKRSGAWPWFNGGPDNRYITQHIITGLGHLKQLSVLNSSSEMQPIIQKAIAYLDQEFVKEYQQMKKYASNINDDHLSNMQMHYLYMRSFFKDIKKTKKVTDVINYYRGQIENYWKEKNLYSQGMLALVMHRMQEEKTAENILSALKENSITSEELGMYWKENTSSWYWYRAPIETQSLLIEAFAEITPTAIETIDNLKIWLLKNKQTNQWKTTKATTEAIYALLHQGSEWLSVTDAVEVLVGGKKIPASKLRNVKVEAGTGYYKTAWNAQEVTTDMAEVHINKKGKGIAWGALYWQYFENLDKISSAETPLKLTKKLYLKKNTATGEEISEINTQMNLNIGDLVRVRIELRADRSMEFVHMKDMRAAGFEPINVLSSYKWQDGLGYYESTKDASTNFFFDFLPKGVYVFEYDLRVNNAGNFSNGITTIQSMYAPEFSSHSEGVRVNIN